MTPLVLVRHVPRQLHLTQWLLPQLQIQLNPVPHPSPDKSGCRETPKARKRKQINTKRQKLLASMSIVQNRIQSQKRGHCHSVGQVADREDNSSSMCPVTVWVSQEDILFSRNQRGLPAQVLLPTLPACCKPP